MCTRGIKIIKNNNEFKWKKEESKYRMINIHVCLIIIRVNFILGS